MTTHHRPDHTIEPDVVFCHDCGVYVNAARSTDEGLREADLAAIRARDAISPLQEGDTGHTMYEGHDCWLCAARDRRILLRALQQEAQS